MLSDISRLLYCCEISGFGEADEVASRLAESVAIGGLTGEALGLASILGLGEGEAIKEGVGVIVGRADGDNDGYKEGVELGIVTLVKTVTTLSLQALTTPDILSGAYIRPTRYASNANITTSRMLLIAAEWLLNHFDKPIIFFISEFYHSDYSGTIETCISF